MDYLSTLKRVFEKHTVGSSFYYGQAKTGVLDLLLENLPTGCVQAMIMGCDVDDSITDPYSLRGVIFWDEGGPAAELVVRDCAWSNRAELTKLIQWQGKAPPRIWFLADKATEVDQHPDYEWETLGACLVGLKKISDPEGWKRVQKRHLYYYEERAGWREKLRLEIENRVSR